MRRQQIETTFISISMMIHQEFVTFNSKLSTAVLCKRRCWKDLNNEPVSGQWTTPMYLQHVALVPMPESCKSKRAGAHKTQVWRLSRSTAVLKLFTCQSTATEELQQVRSWGFRERGGPCSQRRPPHGEGTAVHQLHHHKKPLTGRPDESHETRKRPVSAQGAEKVPHRRLFWAQT